MRHEPVTEGGSLWTWRRKAHVAHPERSRHLESEGHVRICMLTDYFLPHIGGGVEGVVYELSTGLARLGHEVLVVTLNTDGAAGRERIAGVTVVRAPAIQLSRVTGMQVAVAPIAPITAARAIRDFRPDLIHTHSRFFFLSAVAPALKALQQVPLVTTLHVAEIARLAGWSRLAVSAYEKTVARFLLANSDQITVVSDAVLRYATRVLHVDVGTMTVIPNGVDLDRFYPAEDRSNDESGKIVVFVGRLIFNKGPQYLLSAAPRVLERHPDARFVFVGDGPMADELRATTHATGLDGAVEFTGVTDDVPRVLRRADVVVRPSLSEGMPLTVLEAMACGLPVVASTVGGNPEIVRDGITGFLVPPGESAILADRIGDLLDDPPR